MVRRRANLKNQWFVTHEVYRDSLVHELVDAAALELGEDREKVMCMFGKYFAESIGRYGYARLLRVLGRDLRDFLNGLDDLHEYLRFSYPKMKPPSFFCECETVNGLKLNYTSKRSGYLHYVIGQLMTVGRIYGKDLEIELLSEEISDSGTRRIVLDLKFDNSEFLQQRQIAVQQKQFTVDSQTFLSVFPFCLLLDRQLVIQEVGLKICEVLPPIIGMNLAESFVIRKPMLEGVSWRQVRRRVWREQVRRRVWREQVRRRVCEGQVRRRVCEGQVRRRVCEGQVRRRVCEGQVRRRVCEGQVRRRRVWWEAHSAGR